MASEQVLIKVTPEVRDKLKGLGTMGDTYNSVIARLIEADKNDKSKRVSD